MKFPLRSSSACAFVLALCLGLFPLGAQDANGAPSTDSGAVESPAQDAPARTKTDDPLSIQNTAAFMAGDGMVQFKLGANFPLFIQNPNTGGVSAMNLKTGGKLDFRYVTFVTDDIALGGDISFNLNYSIADRSFFFVPICFNVMWAPSYGAFEFPVTLGLGGGFIKLADYNKFDPVIKPEIGALYRVTPSLSVGLTASYTWIPQFYTDASYNRFGNILNVEISACYHI